MSGSRVSPATLLAQQTRAEDSAARAVYADWLEDQGRPTFAYLIRSGIVHGPEPYDLLPRGVWNAVSNHATFDDRYSQRPEQDLFEITQTCLRNLERHDVSPADERLRTELVPEVWERLRPGTRSEVRRVVSTLAEYRHNPMHIPASSRQLYESAENLRQRITLTSQLTTLSLVETTVDTIAASTAARRWSPCTPVYECGFAYQLVPAILHRLLQKEQVYAAPHAPE